MASFPSQAETNMIPNIEKCVEAVTLATDHLGLANRAVGEATQDLPRLQRVLRNQRHFDLVSETEVLKARAHLNSEIQPRVLQLVQKAKESLEREEREMKLMRNKTMQLKSQLDEYGITLNSPPAPETPPLSAETKNAASRAADREVQMLRAKVAAAKKRRELFSREVLALEKQTETV